MDLFSKKDRAHVFFQCVHSRVIGKINNECGHELCLPFSQITAINRNLFSLIYENLVIVI